MVGAERVTSEFFAGTRVLMRGLYGRRRLNCVTDGSATSGVRWIGAPRPLAPFEHWRITLRMQPLAALEGYLRDWPASFLCDAARSHIYRCRFDGETHDDLAAWVADVLDRFDTRAH